MRNFLVFLVGLLLVVVARGTDEDLDLMESGEMLGKKLLSYPTLVSILKARNNATRPILSAGNGQQFTEAQQPPVPVAAHLPPAPSRHGNICSPASQERSQITRLCDGHRRGDVNEESVSKCMESFCVTIISDDDDFDNGFESEIVAYTECESVKNLFKILMKSAVTPKCYECGS